MEKKSLTITKASEYLEVNRGRMKRILDSGKIPTFLNDNNQLRIYKENLDKYLQEYGKPIDIVDPRNKLNNLTGKEWLPETKSFFYQKGLGANHAEAQIEKLHPAPFSFQDIERLVKFFTKEGQKVLDPFGGVGSTAKACELNNRCCTSVELSQKWHDLAIRRLEKEVKKGSSSNHNFVNQDCIKFLKNYKGEKFDFVVTSPPYWSILNKKLDWKTKRRAENNLDTNYSEDSRDIANIEEYQEFLKILVKDVFMNCFKHMKVGAYFAIIVSDFRNKSEYISFHSDLINKMNGKNIGGSCRVSLQGTKILLQNHKSLLPYGYPFAYVENIHHQYVLLFRKVKK